jgi:mono/diheme cytochrome c family protein/plastocyanin
MNTSKQVNTIIGLLMVGAIATLLYWLWDDDRQTAATERQLTENAERGGNLFSLNCRACHGLNGLGSLESSALPGLPLNTDANREADAPRQDYIRGTIECGRVGTQMPPWSIKYGGPLNDFQIDQLMALITGTMTGFDQDPQASLNGWENAIEQANHADEFAPPKHLKEAINDETEVLVLNNARGLRAGNLLRIDDDPEVTDYEVVEIVDAPAGSILFERIGEDDTEISMVQPSVFEPGDIIIIGGEQMEVVSAPPGSTLAADVAADATVLELEAADGFERGQALLVRQEKMQVQSVSGNSLTVERAVDGTTAAAYVTGTSVVEDTTLLVVERGVGGTSASRHNVKSAVFEVGDEIVVERGAFGTEAAEHETGTEVYNGPIQPSDAITGEGEGFPPCGQLPPRAANTGAEVIVDGSAAVTMGDNFFDSGGNQNPTFKVAVGSTVTFNLANDGSAPHNMNIAGPDSEFETDDDAISDPDLITAGQTGVLQFTAAAAGSIDYRCDFHPDQMNGTITVE